MFKINKLTVHMYDSLLHKRLSDRHAQAAKIGESRVIKVNKGKAHSFADFVIYKGSMYMYHVSCVYSPPFAKRLQAHVARYWCSRILTKIIALLFAARQK